MARTARRAQGGRRARAWRRAAVAVLLGCSLGPQVPRSLEAQRLAGEAKAPMPSWAQEPARPTVPGVVRYGKWVAAGLFVTGTALAIVNREQANDAYAELSGYCGSGGSCTIGADGRYTDGGAEAIYQEVVSGDRAARAWLIAGQVALAGAAALFIVELSKDTGTRNIPYSGLLVGPGTIGLTLPFRLD